jgi:hypothetical protein
MQCTPGGLDPLDTGNKPCGKVLRCQAASSGSHVAVCEEGLLQHANASLFNPGPGCQVGTRHHAIQQAELGQYQRAGALCSNQLP